MTSVFPVAGGRSSKNPFLLLCVTEQNLNVGWHDD